MTRSTVNLVVLEDETSSTVEAPSDAHAMLLARMVLAAAMQDRP